MSIENYYDQTIKVVTITKPAEHSTAVQTESCSTAIAAVNPFSGDKRFAAGQNWPFADYKAFMGSSVAVTENTPIDWDGTRYNVVFVKNTLAMGHHKLVYMQRDNYQ